MRNTIFIYILLCLPQRIYPVGVPEWLKTAAGVSYTTVSKTPEAKDKVLNGSLPTSTRGMWGTAAAAILASFATNKVLETNATYRLLNQTTQQIARRYTHMPPWARKRLMPALTFVASSVCYGTIFEVLKGPARDIEKEVQTSLEKELEQKKRPE